MKIFTYLNNYSIAEGGAPAKTFWAILPDSTLLRSQKPTFLPREDIEYRMCPSLCIRIGRLGKRIEPRYAWRYIDGMTAAVEILPMQSLSSINRGEIPYPSDWIFDGCLMVGDMVPTSEEAILQLSTSEGFTLDWDIKNINIGVWEMISYISRNNTIKQGDMLLAGIHPQGVEAKIDTTAAVTFNGSPLLKFNVK